MEQCLKDNFESENGQVAPLVADNSASLLLDPTAARALGISTLTGDSDPQSSGDAFCPVIFDSWKCWPATPAGQVATGSCPDFPNIGFSPLSEYTVAN